MNTYEKDPHAVALGSIRTAKKTASSQQNASKAAAARRGKTTTDAQKEAVKAYWEAYRARKAAEVAQAPTEVKRSPGRPPKADKPEAVEARPVGRPPKPKPETTGVKRSVGRPRKQDAQTALPVTEGVEIDS